VHKTLTPENTRGTRQIFISSLLIIRNLDLSFSFDPHKLQFLSLSYYANTIGSFISSLLMEFPLTSLPEKLTCWFFPPRCFKISSCWRQRPCK